MIPAALPVELAFEPKGDAAARTAEALRDALRDSRNRPAGTDLHVRDAFSEESLSPLLAELESAQRSAPSVHGRALVVCTIADGIADSWRAEARPSGPVRLFRAELRPIGEAGNGALGERLATLAGWLDRLRQAEQIAAGDPSWRIETGVLSCTGTSYRRNMDCYSVADSEYRGVRSAMLAVCDGVGSEEDGDVAARLATARLSALPGALARELSRSEPSAVDLASLVRQSFAEAQSDLREEAARRAGADGPEARAAAFRDSSLATTLAGALVVGRRLVVWWAGDSRVYRLRGGNLALLTRDHSVAVRDRGVADPDRISSVPGGRALTFVLHPNMPEACDVALSDVEEGDVLLVCTDGLHEAASRLGYLQSLLNMGILRGESAQGLARFLVETLWGDDGDNVTLAVAFVGTPSTAFSRGERVPRAVFEAKQLAPGVFAALNSWPERGAAPFPEPPPGSYLGALEALAGVWVCPSCGDFGPPPCPLVCPREACGGAPSCGPSLAVIGPDGTLAVRPLSESGCRIGSAADVAIPGEIELARRHAAIRPLESGFSVEDLGSESGTWGAVLPAQPQTYALGVPVRIGDSLVTVLPPVARQE
jgi:protein phosphatase